MYGGFEKERHVARARRSVVRAVAAHVVQELLLRAGVVDVVHESEAVDRIDHFFSFVYLQLNAAKVYQQEGSLPRLEVAHASSKIKCTRNENATNTYT